MTLFILDPNLDTQHGHHLNWDLSIAREAVDRGEDVTIFANRVFAAAVPGSPRPLRVPRGWASPASNSA